MLIPLGTDENDFKSVLFGKYLLAGAFGAVRGPVRGPGDPGDLGFKGRQKLKVCRRCPISV